MKYRKKPVVVEAYKTDKEVVIHTLEGDMKASIGDYIITGVNGEKYPCKPDIFEKTYEAVTNTNYDKIKAMSVEEMADLLDSFRQCSNCRRYGNNCFPTFRTEEWLKQGVLE